MKKRFDDERLILRACDLYYNQELTQTAVCNELGISRPTLSKLLNYAKKVGILKISISSVHGRNHFEKEALLEKKYGLREVIITESGCTMEAQHALCGQAAASYLDRVLQDGNVVGVGMGAVLTSCISQLKPQRALSGLSFVPLIGGLNSISVAPEIHSNYLCEELAKKYGGAYYPLFAPARVERVQTRNELMQDASVKSIFDMAKTMDVAIVSIGAPTGRNTLVKDIYFSSPQFTVSFFQENNVCGDLCLLCYDKEGRTDIYDFNNNVIAADITQFFKIPCVIGLASGTQKKDAILGAIAGRFINVLITDIACAELLLKS